PASRPRLPPRDRPTCARSSRAAITAAGSRLSAPPTRPTSPFARRSIHSRTHRLGDGFAAPSGQDGRGCERGVRSDRPSWPLPPPPGLPPPPTPGCGPRARPRLHSPPRLPPRPAWRRRRRRLLRDARYTHERTDLVTVSPLRRGKAGGGVNEGYARIGHPGR